eukprot:gnl/TRDRNA2_/TRDRNA2_188751_c0_seq1.p1 gnl/TRDRNA2_/TRDRNA2_188751_c0~~gnl/TRDRNA2_/TRDRNA2_188751_c0_seq1.p1  ORF type:complete len:189 (+),score=61.10 gnl/TRDRNA2_/TRDRNA2_188751_c0_seq1:133-699(+)
MGRHRVIPGANARKTGRTAAKTPKAKKTTSSDATMASAAPKKKSSVKKSINKSKRRKLAAAANKDDAMGVPAHESKKARRKRIALAALVNTGKPGSPAAETPEKLRARQEQEWKDMKAKVALLKKERKSMERRGSERKQAKSQEIRQLMEDMQVRHHAELRAAGLDAPPPATMGGRGSASAKDAMLDV